MIPGRTTQKKHLKDTKCVKLTCELEQADIFLMSGTNQLKGCKETFRCLEVS